VIILLVLQATLDAGPCGDVAFIVGENGRPLTKESFGNEFKAACKAAGVPGASAPPPHGRQWCHRSPAHGGVWLD
jgi:hypothetical protein